MIADVPVAVSDPVAVTAVDVVVNPVPVVSVPAVVAVAMVLVVDSVKWPVVAVDDVSTTSHSLPLYPAGHAHRTPSDDPDPDPDSDPDLESLPLADSSTSATHTPPFKQ